MVAGSMLASATSRRRLKHPMGVLIKPASSRCNLNCAYCFYLPKMDLYPWRDHPKLSVETYEEFLAQYVPMSAPHLSFVWQGGEPTIMGLPFYEQAVEMQRRHAREGGMMSPRPVHNAIQTNGTLLSDDWARFFKQWGFLVGVSLDGPPEVHDRYRVDWSGHPAHGRVMRGIEHLRSHDVAFNVLTVVSQSNVGQPRELLHWMVDQGFEHVQFIPTVEVSPGHLSAIDGGVTEESLMPDQWGRFLNEVFDAWLEIGVEKVRLRWFDNLVQMLWGVPDEECILAPTCGYILLENNGDCYPCDFFVEKDWLLGNIHDTSLVEMIEGEKFRRFSQTKAHLNTDCKECPWLTLCYGGCPRYRVTGTGTAENSLTYFCPSFKQFFGQSYPRLEELAVRLARPMGLATPGRGLSARERTRTAPRSIAMLGQQARKAGTGRNDPCPCGSGRKLKRCCGT